MIFLGLQEVPYWEEIPQLQETFQRLLEAYKPNAQNHGAYEAARNAWYRSTIHGKEDFCRRVERYRACGRPIWVTGHSPSMADLSPEQMDRAFLYAGEDRGQVLAQRPRSPWLEDYAERVLQDSPQRILELTVGAGGGTCAVAARMREADSMIGVDIDFLCAKNADAIGRFYGARLLGVCCSLWQLPFPENSFSAVCCLNGLNECREVPAILQEAVRVLVPGGRMVLTMAASGYEKYRDLFTLFHISQQEGLDLLQEARLYAAPEDVDAMLQSLGMHKTDGQVLENGGVLAEYEKNQARS